MRRFSTSGAILVLAVLGAAACDNGTSTRTGSVTVQLTDAASDQVVEAWVTITDIYLQGEGGEADPPGGRVFLLEDASETHELLGLANTVETLVADREVPTGTYGQLRIVLSGGCIVTDEGEVYASSGYAECGTATGTLQMPSMQQTGIKVNLNGLEVSGGQQIVLLDFSVAESFGRQAGQSGRWVMTPVIHATTIELTGGIDVTLDPGDVELPAGFGLGDFSATLLPANGDPSRVAFAEADGGFTVRYRFLIAENGPFDVRLNWPDGLSGTVAPESPQTVPLASGQTATIDWVLQTVEGGAEPQ